MKLILKPLTEVDFAPFGDVIEGGGEHFPINSGTVQRFHDLATVEVGAEGRVSIGLVRIVVSATLPHTFSMVERHPLGSQAFIPRQEHAFPVVVGPAGDDIAPDRLCGFMTNGRQGINYHRGVWHMPLTGLATGVEFLVIDREGPGNNVDEFHFSDRPVTLERAP